MATILVVDDDQMMLHSTKDLLNALGYKALTANNGQKGLDIIALSAQPVDMVLLDISLPDCNGFDLLPKMLSIQSDLKIVLTTGYLQEESEESLHKKGAAGFLQKPYTLADLKKTLETVLDI